VSSRFDRDLARRQAEVAFAIAGAQGQLGEQGVSHLDVVTIAVALAADGVRRQDEQAGRAEARAVGSSSPVVRQARKSA